MNISLLQVNIVISYLVEHIYYRIISPFPYVICIIKKIRLLFYLLLCWINHVLVAVSYQLVLHFYYYEL